MNWNYVIMMDGCFYTEKAPVWGPTFTKQSGDAKVFCSQQEAYEKMDSWQGKFPTARVVKTEIWRV